MERIQLFPKDRSSGGRRALQRMAVCLALAAVVAPLSAQAPKERRAVRPEALREVQWVPPPVISLGLGDQLAVPLYGQETNVWCWDASSLMVIKYFRPSSPLTQCQIATQATPGASCCQTPFPAPCVHPGWEMLTKNGFAADSTGTALAWTDFTTQISTKKKPVLFAWGWNGGGGHMLVADGWFTLAAHHYVRVNNPWPPGSGAKESYTYEAWVGGPGYDHITWANWYNIADTRKVIFKNPILYQAFRYVPSPGPDPLGGRLAVHPEATRRATTTLEEIRTVPPALATHLGFANAAEAKEAQLGTPLREYSVHLDTLRAYTPGAPAARSLAGGTTLFYPVVARGAIRSSVRVAAPAGEAPRTISIADTGTAGHLQLLEELAPRLRAPGGESIPAVRIPALGLYFVARASGSTLEVASLFDVPQYEIKRGRYEKLETVLARLAPIAKALPDGAM